MATIGRFSAMLPVDPWKPASPKLKIPPSDATNQYPFPLGVAAIPTIAALSCSPASEPLSGAAPKASTPPAVDAPAARLPPTAVATTDAANRTAAANRWALAKQLPGDHDALDVIGPFVALAGFGPIRRGPAP